MSTRIVSPYESFMDIDGEPLENGSIYIGEPNLNPESNPKSVFWDEALTIPATQPIMTSGGFPVNNGSASNIFVDGDYSILIRNKNGSLIRSLLSQPSSVLAASSSSIQFTSVDNLKSGIPQGESLSIAPSLSASMDNGPIKLNTHAYYEGNKYGSANYFGMTISDARTLKGNILWTPNGYGDHYLFGGISYVAVLILDESNDITQFGALEGVGTDFDNSVPINAFIASIGGMIAPIGDFELQNPLIIRQAITSSGTLWKGSGMEQTRFNCVNMVGKSAIQLESSSGLYRITMRDFQIDGDCGSAIYLETSGELFQSHFENLVLRCGAGDCFFAERHFSTSWYNVHTQSQGGNGFALQGGNSTALINCYAHNIPAAGKAGYKIKGGATLIACNGLDSGETWGIFGADIANDGENVIYRISIIGGNAEEFTETGIKTRFQGSIYMENFAMLAPSAAVTPTFDGYVEMNCSSSTLVRNSGTWVSKGSVIQNLAQVKTNGNQFRIELNQEDAPEPEYEQGGLLYKAATAGRTNEVTAFGIRAQNFNLIDCERNYGFNVQLPVTWTANTTSFNVSGRHNVETANTLATQLRSATGFVDQQDLFICINDSNTTVVHFGGGAGQFRLKSGANETPAQGDVYHFKMFDGVTWSQV